jgi:sodium/potassium-transporting ATPase subunit alpha
MAPTDEEKEAKRAALAKEVKMTVHMKAPHDGVMELADEFGFPRPSDIGWYMNNGLTTAQADAVRERHHDNALTPPPTTPWWLLFIEHQTGFFSLLLWSASLLCFVSFGIDPVGIDNLYLGIVLAVVVFLTGCFSYYQEASSAAVMEGFKNMIPPMVSAVRDGKMVTLEAALLVPGDVVVCNTGEKLPADVRVVTYTNFKCDQSSLTGEPDAIKKNDKIGDEKPLEATNLAFFGTMVAEGDAKGFVVLTGDDTVMGHIAALASGVEADDTPIAKEIHHFIMLISALAIFLGITFFIVAITTAFDLVKSLVFGIGIIVANVPEGLLATVTVSLTLTAKRLAKKQVLVKQLESVETLGSTTCICSDKTGTLTQNRMTVQHVYVNNKICDVPFTEEGWAGTNAKGAVPTQLELRKGAHPESLNLATLSTDKTFERLYKFGILCNSGEFTQDDRAKPALSRLCCNGNASDYAFLKMIEVIPAVSAMRKAAAADFGIDQIRKAYPSANGKTSDIPFNSKYKFMTTVRAMEEGDVVIMKGAAEQVFSRCGSILIDGVVVPIDAAMKARFLDVYETVAKLGERGLGFAYRELGDRPKENWEGGNPEQATFPLGNVCKESNGEDTSDSLTYIGLMALIDPPREAVPSSVLLAQRAGVKVVMVTGDHPTTAAAIAKVVNIMPDKNVKEIAEDEGISIEEASAKGKAIVCAGVDLDNMSQAEIQQVLLYPQVVFARTSPTQKLLIVEAAQKMGHIVAVTGDGVNDSPALSQADIGCAMGIAGTEVSKEAADMILLSDDFSAIVDGIEEGRLIFDNLKKSIAYTLSSNIPEISPFLLFILVRMPLSLTTVLILCVDLGTDMIPAISLAYEQPESDIMLRPPRDAEFDRLVTDKLIFFAYLQIGVFQALAGFYTFFVVLNDYGWPMGEIPGAVFDFFPYPTQPGNDNRIIDSCPCGGGEKSTGKMFETDEYVDIKDGMLYDKKGKLDQDELDSCKAADIGIEWDENWPYGYGCPYGSLKPTRKCKFDKDDFWGKPCYHPSLALRVAQTSAFVSIVIVQWADLLICKTRLLSIADQGMQNKVMLFGLCSETILCMFLCYVPFMNLAFSTAPIHPVHWFPSMPFSMLIFIYDETRKWSLRRERRILPDINDIGFVERFTYY